MSLQGDTERKTYGSVLQTAHTLYAKGGCVRVMMMMTMIMYALRQERVR